MGETSSHKNIYIYIKYKYHKLEEANWMEIVLMSEFVSLATRLLCSSEMPVRRPAQLEEVEDDVQGLWVMIWQNTDGTSWARLLQRKILQYFLNLRE